SRDRRGGDVHPSGRERDGNADDPREYGVGRDRRPDLMDVEPDRGTEHAHRGVGVALREPGHVHGDGDRRGGSDDRGEQRDEPVGHGGYGGQHATVGDREGRERESGGAGGGDVHGGTGERDDHGRQSDHQRERGGDGGELDAERHGGREYVDGDVGVALREPGHVHGHRHGGSVGHHGKKLGGQPHGAGGHPPADPARRARERPERESGDRR